MAGTVRQWFAARGEAEALYSLAGFAYANPGYALPEITTHALQYEARQLGHPLILAGKRVSNDFSMDGLGKTLVVTGSNMSGKSTFLRTLGINAVLALAGAPVCATACRLSVFRVFTAMRTQDSLEESVSSFYAELKRLRQLIELLPTGQPVFYLLDEILKGTNSHDRHEGAKALIRQLHKHHASGLVSTHDLALGQLGEVSPEYVQNYSFNSDFADGKLHFDYKLREGVCRSFNASQLMRQMGIEM
jgi:DNA mismatch repair ATPase MutS